MEHNDQTDKDLPLDPDATSIVPVDAETRLHMELDAERALAERALAQKKASRSRIPLPRPAAGRPPSIATVRAMRAAPRASSSRFPSAKSALPRPPIHRLPPSHRVDDEDSDAAATRVFDRNSLKMRATTSSSSVTSVSFPAAAYSAPRIPQPFHTVPAIPAAKRVVPPAHDSAPTPVEPILAPTSRREIRVVSAVESLAPMAMSAFPSSPPPLAPAPATLSKSSIVAIVLTMVFTLAAVAAMGLGIFKPSAIEHAKIALAAALEGKAKAEPAIEPTSVEPPPAAAIAVPAVLIDDLPAELGEKETALFLPESAKGHRVFVDGKVINEADPDAPVAIATCGKHKVQLGSTGKEQVLDLPCHRAAHLE